MLPQDEHKYLSYQLPFVASLPQKTHFVLNSNVFSFDSLVFSDNTTTLVSVSFLNRMTVLSSAQSMNRLSRNKTQTVNWK
jgi:hypothetical protein